MDSIPTCSTCDRPLICEICETCADHCRYSDPVRCAQETVNFSVRLYGENDEHTEVARGQLLRATERTRPS